MSGSQTSGGNGRPKVTLGYTLPRTAISICVHRLKSENPKPTLGST
jgi:hypothetical protein